MIAIRKGDIEKGGLPLGSSISLKEKITKALEVAGGVKEINWGNLGSDEEINGIIYQLQTKDLLNFDIEHLVSGGSGDYAVTYYSEKLCKTIIFDYEAQTSFQDFDEFIKWVDRLNKEVVEFEEKIKFI